MRTCEDGCNGCDDCTDYDDEGVTVQSKIQLMAVAKAEDTSRIFELEQRCAALEEQADLDTIRMGRLAESNQKLKDLNREMFVSRCQAHMRTERLEDFLQRMLEAATPQIGHAWKEEIRQVLVEDVPDSKTPSGCHENGCLGWCDEHRPEAGPDSKTPNARLSGPQRPAQEVEDGTK